MYQEVFAPSPSVSIDIVLKMPTQAFVECFQDFPLEIAQPVFLFNREVLAV